jgi:hypothetical protein
MEKELELWQLCLDSGGRRKAKCENPIWKTIPTLPERNVRRR